MVRKTNTKKREKSEKRTTMEIHFRESDILQRWLLVADGCPSCKQIKSDLKSDFKSGKIRAANVGDEKGFEMLSTLGIDSAPMFIIEFTPEAEKRTGVKYLIDE